MGNQFVQRMLRSSAGVQDRATAGWPAINETSTRAPDSVESDEVATVV
jgi:hypothetical protein